MKYILFSLTLISSIYLSGMEKPQTTDRALLGNASLANLPTDLKKIIIIHISAMDTPEEAGKSLHNVSKTNKQFSQLINDPKTTQDLIHLLQARMAPCVAPYNKVTAAYYLQTPGACLWLKNYNHLEKQERLNETFKGYLSWQPSTKKEKIKRNQMLLFLLKAGLDTNKLTTYNQTLLKVAFWTSDKKITDILFAFIADINKVANHQTILDAVISLQDRTVSNLPTRLWFSPYIMVLLRARGAKTYAELLEQEQS